MTIARVYVPPGYLGPDRLEAFALAPEAAHHLSRVLRARAGDQIVVFDGTSGEFEARIERIARETVEVCPTRYVDVSRESQLRVCLALGLSRRDRMDFAVQKAVELGIAEITPLATERSRLRASEAHAGKRLAHWRKVIISACEQSGRTSIPELRTPVALADWMDAEGQEPHRFFFDREGAAPAPACTAAPLRVAMAVGPEGGFSSAERHALTGRGFAMVGLGPRTLRTETAAVAATVLIQSLWGDLRAG